MTLGGIALLAYAATLAAAVLAPNFGLQIGLLFVANCCSSTALPNLTAVVADIIEAPIRGLGFSATQFLLILGGAFGPGLVGVVSQTSGSLSTAFLSLLVPLVIGAVVVLSGRSHYDEDAARALGLAPAAP
jgi:MFS family permease